MKWKHEVAQGDTILINGRLIDGAAAAPVPNETVVMRDWRIIYASPIACTPPTQADISVLKTQSRILVD